MLITGYRFNLTCPIDGHQLEHAADGRSTGTTAQAIAVCCGPAHHQILITTTLTPTGKGRHTLPSKQRTR